MPSVERMGTRIDWKRWWHGWSCVDMANSPPVEVSVHPSTSRCCRLYSEPPINSIGSIRMKMRHVMPFRCSETFG